MTPQADDNADRPAISAQRLAKVYHLFDITRRLARSRRADFLKHACGTDHDLRREVESLLAHYRQLGDDFMRVPR